MDATRKFTILIYNMKKCLSFLLWLNLIFMCARAQETFPVNGTTDKRAEKFLFIHAKIIQDYKSEPLEGSMLIEKGKIVKIAKGDIKEMGAVVVDVKGSYIYPSFIELYAQYGIEPNVPKDNNGYPQFVTKKDGAYDWNEAIRPEYNAYENFKLNAKAAQPYIDNGFGAVLTHNIDGIVRGSGALLTLATGKKEHEIFIQDKCATFFSFDKGTSRQDYPNSLMGSIALLRQTYYDALWYSSQKQEYNISLEAFNRLQSLPVFFNTSNWQDIFRAQKIANEFKKNYIYVGNGDEYKRIQEIKNAQVKLVVPIDLPQPYNVEDPNATELLSFAQLKYWEDAPYNIAFLQQANIDFALTSTGLKNPKDFFKNISKCIQSGADKKNILKALTFTPAKMLGKDSMLGTLEKGKYANFIITDKPLFDEGFSILQNWTQGELHELKPISDSIYAKYILKYAQRQDTLSILFSTKKDEAQLKLDTVTIKPNVDINADQINLSFDLSDKNYKGVLRFYGWKRNNGFAGNVIMPDGKNLSWTATEIPFTKKADTTITKKDTSTAKLPEVFYPYTSFGKTKLPTAQKVLFKNATVWTNEKEGILQQTDVLVDKGKIVKIGKKLNDADAIVVDATNKHLTSGIIDEHSHISIWGNVNECTQTSTADVRIGDVLTNDDVNMYRQLAGGVVAAQLLHGSCNPIGGQSALVKFRWGSMPEDLKIKNADGFIKFALGENVKQSNWGERQSQRFPQTRMGVEQVYMDYFTRAVEYSQNKNARKNLNLEAVAEIINKKRFISCHSYVQSEINMLMKTAEKFNFRINTFTHILEGYKVADKMKQHGVGASTFSDWWAYKMEVMEAIPWNAVLLNKMGITTAINSDDAEMGRRLNQEAAKSVKYGGMSEEDAWKMVTLNPAKLLHLDKDMGSIKEGKSADLVLWSDNPLSIYARAEQTYVDGIKYYDSNEETSLLLTMQTEKARIIQKMWQAKKEGTPTQPVIMQFQTSYHCNDVGQYHESQK